MAQRWERTTLTTSNGEGILMHRVFIHSSHGKVWGNKDGGSHFPLPRVADETQYAAGKFCMLVVL